VLSVPAGTRPDGVTAGGTGWMQGQPSHAIADQLHARVVDVGRGGVPGFCGPACGWSLRAVGGVDPLRRISRSGGAVVCLCPGPGCLPRALCRVLSGERLAPMAAPWPFPRLERALAGPSGLLSLSLGLGGAWPDCGASAVLALLPPEARLAAALWADDAAGFHPPLRWPEGGLPGRRAEAGRFSLRSGERPGAPAPAG